jgi:hypothetical protein
MPELSVDRTLVKPPPEVWPEFSDVESLANHLGEFGEISISRLEPEHTVAWEGEHASGTVSLEPCGQGTRVIMKAHVREEAVQAPTVHQVIPDLEAWDRSAAQIENHAGWQTAAAQRAAQRAAERAERERKRSKRLFRGRRARQDAEPVMPTPAPEPTVEARKFEPAPEERARAVLEGALENLGSKDRPSA